MMQVQRLSTALEPNFTEFCQNLNTEISGLGTTLAHIPRCELMVALLQDSIVGVAQLQGNFLAKLLVLPRYRRQGVASTLIGAIAMQCHQAGYSELCLDTSQSLKAALALYHKLGFVPAPAHALSAPSALHLHLDLNSV